MARVKKYAKVDDELSRKVTRDQKNKKEANKVRPNAQSRFGSKGNEKQGFPSRSSSARVNTLFKEANQEEELFHRSRVSYFSNGRTSLKEI